MTPLPLTGACGCGAVRFEIGAPLGSAAYCHCTRCRHRTGNAYGSSVAIAEGSLRIVSGEEHLSTWKPENGNAKVFCSRCGSGLWSSWPDDGPVAGVRVGALDGDPEVEFSHHQWVGSAVSWEPIAADGLPRYDGPRPR